METKGAISKLGFGMMRLPRRGVFIDQEVVNEMTDRYLEAGGTYFDTAFIYPGSEQSVKRALADRHNRDEYYLATKLNAFIPPLQTMQMARNQLETSLERTGAGYFDFYLLHSLMDSNISKYDRMKLWDYVQEEKAKGKIRHCGFSYHAGPERLDRLLEEHKETEFVQLQINYADWESGNVQSRMNYEVARKHNVPIVIMEPVKGGKLANPPEKVRKIFSYVHPDWSYASWALRFAMSLDGVMTVLSGMSSMEQMEDNLKTMKSMEMGDAERAALREVQGILGESRIIPCTACKYCSGCPKEINIPGIFEAMNMQLGDGRMEAARACYAENAGEHGADTCIACHKCESACPQHINISEHMRTAARMFETAAES